MTRVPRSRDHPRRGGTQSHDPPLHLLLRCSRKHHRRGLEASGNTSRHRTDRSRAAEHMDSLVFVGSHGGRARPWKREKPGTGAGDRSRRARRARWCSIAFPSKRKMKQQITPILRWKGRKSKRGRGGGRWEQSGRRWDGRGRWRLHCAEWAFRALNVMDWILLAPHLRGW